MKTAVALPLPLLLLITIWPLPSSSASPEMAKQGCRSTCGNVSVPFPFGMGHNSNCYLNESFHIYCDESHTPPRPFSDELQISSLSLNGHVRIDYPIMSKCVNLSYLSMGSKEFFEGTNVKPPFTLSASHNKFTIIGCDMAAFVLSIESDLNFNFLGGCMTICDKRTSEIDGSCSGIGCCQISIPKGHRGFVYGFTPWLLNSSSCISGFMVDQDRFNFSAAYLQRDYFTDKTTMPMVLNWALGESTCEQAHANRSFMCDENSKCYNSDNGPGYLCRCRHGFRGNPYLRNGCQDIDECKERNPCSKSEICTNFLGSHSCTCRPGTHHINGSKGCGNPKFPALQVALGVPLSILFLLLLSSWLYWGFQKRRFIKLKKKFFEANGGLLLQRQLLTQSRSTSEAAQIFTEEEIKRATDNYSDSRIIGRGGCGIVYKGILPNNRLVAIKKSKLDEGVRQTAQFINEITILLQVNHRNVVKLLGCCLEVQVPLLVYEFVPNGTLFQHIHVESQASSISWNNRLRIAAEAAGALAYLHSSASIPILHGDVKSANILLDNNYTAKVSDFGTSKLVPLDHNQITTLVQGTLGYLDPEYFQTSQLTDKSDVYSFGVVLVELLSAQMPISFECSHEDRNLSMRFISSMKQNRLEEMLEARVLDEATKEQVEIVAQLAWRCLEVKGVERPSMKEVAAELEGLRGFGDHPWMEDTQEAQHLLGDVPSSSNTQMEGIESIQRDVMLSLEMGR